MKPLIILTGPTAVGKTDLSIELAKKVNGEIISADSIQVYKYMNIGSAKITQDEMKGIQHYLIDELEPNEDFNVNIFKEKAVEYINEIYNKGKIPIIAGGTGFYIQSVLYDIKFDEETTNIAYRTELEQLAIQHGNSYVHNMLKEIDPKSADKIHKNNLKRVIRALEYNHNTGLLISEHNEQQSENISPYNFCYFVLNNHRDILYDRINKRVDLMFEQGLTSEVENLLKMGYKKDLVSMSGIGYKEVVGYLEGNFTLDYTIDLIKKNTRHFAKRQMTWFRREKEVTMVDLYNYNSQKDVLDFIINALNKKNILN